MEFKFPCKALLACIAAASLAAGCVSEDESLGEDYIADNQRYNIYTTEFELDDIEMLQPDSLSGFNLYKITVGAIRDKEFGLTTRSSAFTIVPLDDTLDFGEEGTQVFRQFHLAAPLDTVSTEDRNQAGILQNLNVYELTEPIDLNKAYPEVKYDSSVRISDGIPVITGTDSLSFDFTQEFGEKYMQILQSDLDTLPDYTAKFPGIYLTVDNPLGYGGRITMFKLPVSIESGYIAGAYAELKFSATYDDRGQIDTSFYFYLGPADLYEDLDEVTSTSPSTYPQFALDLATHESGDMAGDATDVVWFEGGHGLKPVIKASPIRRKLLAEMTRHGDPSKMVVNKATIELYFDAPDDYKDFDLYPVELSPTCQIVTDTSVTFAGISDASSSDENQGTIDRSNLKYAPDISHHVEELITLEDTTEISNYDIWLLGMAYQEVSTSSSSSSSDLSDYYTYLAYQSYYNNMYSGYGYGGYSSYSNYYNYAMLASLYASSSSSSSTEEELMMDSHRFYRLALYGPDSEDTDKKPKMKVTYAVPVAE